jgi:hypothetical protein
MSTEESLNKLSKDKGFSMLRPRKRYFSVIASDFEMGNRFDQAMFDHCIEVLISPTNPIKDILSKKKT